MTAVHAPDLEGVDHVHVFVRDRAAAVQWYASVLGFEPVESLRSWATRDGPLTIGSRSGAIHLALFEGGTAGSATTIALAATASQFLAWRAHLGHTLGQPLAPVDHTLAWSLYFTDPDGNPFEITTYDHAQVASQLGPPAGRGGDRS